MTHVVCVSGSVKHGVLALNFASFSSNHSILALSSGCTSLVQFFITTRTYTHMNANRANHFSATLLLRLACNHQPLKVKKKRFFFQQSAGTDKVFRTRREMSLKNPESVHVPTFERLV